ncbi:MAG: NAD(P)/FAD-dependent oxidoreductase, partial [Candidatus Neomarinimicrobiota bacterium]
HFGLSAATMKEVTIIGGSAAGFYAGQVLARNGAKVQIFEAQESLNHSPRTLIVTQQIKDLLGPTSDGAVINQISRFELFADGKVGSIVLENPDLVIDRSRLIRLLALEASRLGIETTYGRRFVDIRSTNGHLTVVLEKSSTKEKEYVSSSSVIGADGAFSRVRQSAGWPRNLTVPLMQAIVRLPGNIPPYTCQIWFLPEDTPYFYWLIPESSTTAAVGVIGEDGQKMREGMIRFLKKKNLEPLEFQAARIPFYNGWLPVRRPVGGGNVYLVGDAAGHIKVSTVGGIVTGLKGARAVASAIVNGSSSSELRALRRELNLHLLVRRVLHRWKENDYSNLLELLDKKCKYFLGAIDRDQPRRLLSNLILSQPKLLLMGIRSFLTGSSLRDRISRAGNGMIEK